MAVLTPADDLYAVMEIILGRKQRLVPVPEDGHVSAVITRTDLTLLMAVLINDKLSIAGASSALRTSFPACRP